MVMIPPLVRDPLPDERQSSTGRPVSGRMVRPQRRYASNLNISFEYEPPRPIPRPGVPPPASTFDKWRAAAELDPPGGGAGDPSSPAARGDASVPGATAAPRRTLHDVLLGTTAVVLLGVLGGIGYLAWSGALPGRAASPGGAAPKGSGVAAAFQSLADSAAQAVARPSPERNAAPSPAQDVATDVPTPRPAPPPAALLPPSTAPASLALAAPMADKPTLAGPPPPASGSSAVAAGAVPAPGQAAAEPVPRAKPSELGAAAPTPAVPAAPTEAVPLPASAPAPERAAAATVPPDKAALPDATPPAPAAEQAAAKAVPPARPPASDAAPAAPSVVSMTVRLPPAPEWTMAPPAALASLPEAATPPPALPAVPASSAPSAGPAAVPDEAAKAVLPGVDAQQVVSTMTLVQQMSLLVHDMHDEGLRYRTEVTALTGAVQAKASSLEERLKLAEARSAAGSDAGGLPASDAPQVLRGYRVQAGSPGAAVLSDEKAGPERAARLLVMVGDQVPGAGRVTAIVQRGQAWIVRTERGVIQ